MLAAGYIGTQHRVGGEPMLKTENLSWVDCVPLGIEGLWLPWSPMVLVI